ncbi:cupin domain-containing protein [Spirillospora sp. NBC_00431]
MVMSERRRAASGLPPGVELYTLGPGGDVRWTAAGGTRDLADGLLPFIDDGQFAHYLIGDAATSLERPSNATYKLGVVAPHSSFTPHAHRGEHFVVSLGYAACGLYDAGAGRVVDVRLAPGTMIRIPAMLPHSFANRAARPLLILAANTGYGIDHEDYAITAGEAERRAAGESAGQTGPPGVDYHALGAALREIERTHGRDVMTWRERLGAGLRRAASRLEGTS